MTVRTPKYRLHKGSGQALIQINSQRIYLGKYGSSESKERYRQVVAEWLARGGDAGRPPSSLDAINPLTVVELILAYMTFAMTYYVKDGEPTDEIFGLKAAFRPLRKLYGRDPAAAFGPMKLKTVRQQMIEAGHSRKYVNENVARIKRMFKWAVSEELLPVGVFQSLATLSGLRKGRTTARETPPVLPVDDGIVTATLEHLPVVVADMVRFQRLVGCRPGEVRKIRPCEVDRSADVWAYRPARHKTEHTGRERVIFIGPKAQDVLLPYLDHCETTAFCFSPSEGRARRRTTSDAHATRRISPCASSRRAWRSSERDCYARSSYNSAIRKACRKGGIPHWAPNQLRHSLATEIRQRYGVEGAQTVLGHAQADVTQVYAERDFELAKRIMREVG